MTDPTPTLDRLNPLGRKYSLAEFQAAKSRGLETAQSTPYAVWSNGGPKTAPGGPLIYATGDWHPTNARKQAARARKAAAEWDLVADAMDREWSKP